MMRNLLSSLPDAQIRLRRSLSVLSVGGSWALSLPANIQNNLRWYWFDGFFSAASDNIVVTYLTVYLLALGATGAQIGMLSSLSSLSAALLLIPGALLVERVGYRKPLAVTTGGLVGRSMILLLAVFPFFWKGPELVYFAIALAVVRDSMGNLAFPAWMSITGDIVPLEGRGRYFGSRNFVMGIAGMAVTLAAGEVITRAGNPAGYQIAFGAAFLLGLVSTFCFSRLRDPRGNTPVRAAHDSSFAGAVRDLRAQPSFLWLVGTAAVWNLSLNIAGPFFTVHLVKNLHATPTLVALTTIATTFASLASQRKVGELSDRWGARRVQLVSSLLIPILPFGWFFISAGWQVIPLNLLGGLLWGAFSLASFNFLLALIPAEQRARYSAIHQIVVLVSLAAGAALGSLVVTQWGYRAVFLVSGLGRLVAVAMFSRFVHEPASGSHSEPALGPAV